MRKTKEINITDRGTLKSFRITEMPASKFEWWIVSVGRLLAGCGAAGALELGDMTDSSAVQEALARFLVTDGLKSLGNLDLDKVKPLYDDLLRCVELKSGDYYAPLNPETVDGMIEDVKTLFILRKEALMLHIDFLESVGSAVSPTASKVTASNTRRPKISAV